MLYIRLSEVWVVASDCLSSCQ